MGSIDASDSARSPNLDHVARVMPNEYGAEARIGSDCALFKERVGMVHFVRNVSRAELPLTTTLNHNHACDASTKMKLFLYDLAGLLLAPECGEGLVVLCAPPLGRPTPSLAP